MRGGLGFEVVEEVGESPAGPVWFPLRSLRFRLLGEIGIVSQSVSLLVGLLVCSMDELEVSRLQSVLFTLLKEIGLSPAICSIGLIDAMEAQVWLLELA